MSTLPPTTSGSVTAPAVTYGAEVCHVNAWTNVKGVGADVQLAIAPLEHGAAVLSVPTRGGPVTGFTFDQYGIITGDPAGTVLRSDRKFTSVRAGVVDGRLITAISDGSVLQIDAVREDLGQHAKIAAVEGAFAAQVPVLHARGTRIMPTASTAGVSYSAFDEQWRETHEVFAFHTGLTTGMDAAQLHGETGDTLVTWSTRDSCDVYRLIAKQYLTMNEPCGSPRLASRGDGDATLVFENRGRIGRYDLRGGSSDLKSAVYLSEHGTSPRAVFDGKRTWMSYLDIHGNLAVGFLGDDGELVRTSIAETPAHGAYELAMVDGAPWVFTANATGFFAYEMCAVPQIQ